MKILSRFGFVILLLLSGPALFGATPQKQHTAGPVEAVFSAIEQGIREGNIERFSQYFSSQTYLSLASGYSGYCSANQAFYILHNYFKLNQSIQFKITNSGGDENPYATGIYTFEQRNRRGTAQVFISLRQANNRWFISQFTIR